MKRDIYILGIGNNTPLVIDLIEDCGWSIRGLIHYNKDLVGQVKWGYPVLCDFEMLFQNIDSVRQKNFALSMGDVRIKAELYNRIKSNGGNIPTIIHPSAYVSRRSRIGNGVQIMQGSIVEADVRVGDDTVITVNTVIAHTSVVGQHNLISGNVMVGAYTNIGDFTHIGQGATIVSGKVRIIGNNCIIGAGAVVTKNVSDYAVVIGVPAEIIKYQSE